MDTPDGISVVDLATFGTKPVVQGKVRVIATGRKTGNVYYWKDGAIYAADVDTGATRKILNPPARASVATINTDEALLAGTMLRGTIRSDGTGLTKIQTRTMAMEIAGDEFWSHESDLQIPRGEVFWLAGYNVKTGERTWYHLERDEQTESSIFDSSQVPHKRGPNHAFPGFCEPVCRRSRHRTRSSRSISYTLGPRSDERRF